MHVHMNTGGIAQTNCYLVADEATRQAVLFDAPNDTTFPLLQVAKREGYDLIGLWLTHGHFDHVADHARVTEAFPAAKVLIHPLDEPKLTNPFSAMFVLPFMIPPRAADAYVQDGQRLMLGAIPVDVIHTPGHAPGHVMYHFPSESLLIGGDLIIMNAVGRTDFPDSSEADLYASIRRVMKLPPETQMLAGHGDPSTLGHELQTNEYVQHAMNGDDKIAR
jgi:hydroxyacylglutathione hydrolase